MVLEVAIMIVKAGEETDFEEDFKTAGQYISSINGYIGHTLKRCLEQQNKYILLVEWQKLSDHTIGFRQSPQYLLWKNLLHHYYDPFPTVEHYETVLETKK